MATKKTSTVDPRSDDNAESVQDLAASLRQLFGLAVYRIATSGGSKRLVKLTELVRGQLGLSETDVRNLTNRARQWDGLLQWLPKEPAAAERKAKIEADFATARAQAEDLRRRADEIISQARKKAEADGFDEAEGVLKSVNSARSALDQLRHVEGESIDLWPSAGTTESSVLHELSDAQLVDKIAAELGIE